MEIGRVGPQKLYEILLQGTDFEKSSKIFTHSMRGSFTMSFWVLHLKPVKEKTVGGLSISIRV